MILRISYIKIIFFYFICALLINNHCLASEEQCPSQVQKIITKDGQMTPIMIEILNLMGIQIKGNKSPEWPKADIYLENYSCENVLAAVQAKKSAYSWLRKGQRWEMKIEAEKLLAGKNIEKILSLILEKKSVKSEEFGMIEGLGLGQAVNPQKKSYNSIVFLGTTYMNAEKRANYLEKLLENHLNIILVNDLSPLYILTGRRSLNDQEKSVLKNLKLEILLEQNDEAPVMKWVVSDKKRPLLNKIIKSIQDHQLTNDAYIINDQIAKNLPRASTESTAMKFFDDVPCPENNSYLCISSHMFCLYQELILKRVAIEKNKNVQIEVVGDKIIDEYKDSIELLAVALDNLSRILWEIKSFKKLTGKYPI